MDLRRSIEKNIFVTIASYRIDASTWRRIQNSYGCDEDTHGDCLSNEKPYSKPDHHFGESYEESSGCYQQS